MIARKKKDKMAEDSSSILLWNRPMRNKRNPTQNEKKK
jgi:hypothetical protein